jgi:hypothetical protein
MRKTTPIARTIRPIVQNTMLIFGNNSETSKRTPKTSTSFLSTTFSIPANQRLHAGADRGPQADDSIVDWNLDAIRIAYPVRVNVPAGTSFAWSADSRAVLLVSAR